MRIVLSVIQFPRYSESFIVNKFLGLLDRGLDVHLVCSSSNFREWRRLHSDIRDHDRIWSRVHENVPKRPRWLPAILLPLLFLKCLAKNPRGTWRYFSKGPKHLSGNFLRNFYFDAVFISLKPDVLHFEFGTLAVGKMHLKEILNCKIVVSFRGYDLNYVGLDKPDYYREVFDRADVMHLLGNDLWQRALRRGCNPEKNHVLIPPAIDPKLFENDGDMYPPNGKVRILSVGRLEWKKGYEYALKAIRLLRDQGVDCEYRIIGEGKYLESLSFLRHLLALEDSVTFLASCEQKKVREELLRADIFLHTAVSEGFCNAVIEAQAMKLPVVCSDADGLSENVADGVTGFVVARRNDEALAEKLKILAQDSQLRNRMGEAGRERVLKHFCKDDQIQAFVNMYQQFNNKYEGK
jgi:colanic acid/amylovoran biosynthesis glycosyltransferase